MKIAFLFQREAPFDAQTVRTAPSGGTEKAVAYLAEALKRRGHQVEIQTNPTCSLLHPPDVVIAQEAKLFQRDGGAGKRYPDAKAIWWSHHFDDQAVTIQAAPYARVYADASVCLSECQRERLAETLKISAEVIRYGVNLDEIKPSSKIPARLIYCSTPFRGLARIPELWPRLKGRVPSATLHVCSGMGIYGQQTDDEAYQGLYDQLNSLDGVYVHGPLNEIELFEKLRNAQVFFYPCDWAETYCLALDEALAHGCYPITSGLAALGERAHAFDFEKDTWIDAIEDLSNGVEPPSFIVAPRSWDEAALEWEKLF